MKKKTQLQIVSALSAAIVLSGVVLSRVDINKRKEIKEEDIIPKETVEEVVSEEPVRYEFHYYNDTVDVEESISELGITDYSAYPYSSYKYIRFVDMDSHERYAIVNVYVDYITDENKTVTGTIYTYRDVFSGRVLLTTTDKKNIVDFDSDVVFYLMEYGDLLGLKESVISKGLDSEYANSVMSNNIKDKSLSLYDVARFYVLLVNSNNRLSNEYVMIIG